MYRRRATPVCARRSRPSGRRAYELLRWIRITDLLVEVDELTGMSQHFTHLQTGDPVDDPRALYTVLLAEATNLGLATMAQAGPDPLSE